MTLIRRGLHPRSRGDEGSIVLVLMMIIVITISIVAITSNAMQSLSLSSSQTVRNDYLQSATAGVQSVVAEIRAASNSYGFVVPSQLPCTVTQGNTNASSSTSYSATVQYYIESLSGSYTAEGCVNGLGPTVTTSNGTLARAVITSCAPANGCPSGTGSGGTGQWRRVVSTYSFATVNANIPGGEILTPDQNGCLVAVMPNGVPDTSMYLADTTSCSPGNANYNLEQFVYDQSWQIEIQINNVNWCLQDPEDASSPVAGPLTFSTCTNGYIDQWGVNDSSEIQGVATNNSGDPNSWCINVVAESATPQAVNLQGCYSGNENLIVQATVGSGGAAPTGSAMIGVTDQLVNYGEFGRCLDDTNQNTSWSYMISYPCKQFPDAANYPIWNQRWCYNVISSAGVVPEQGVLYTAYGSTSCGSASSPPASPYCLISPGYSYTSNPSGHAWPYLSACTPFASVGSLPSNELWSAYGSSGGSVHDYTWVDYKGNCLEANSDVPMSGAPWSSISVDTCSGSYAQKWNAPPSLGLSQVGNTHEGTGSGAYTGP